MRLESFHRVTAVACVVSLLVTSQALAGGTVFVVQPQGNGGQQLVLLQQAVSNNGQQLSQLGGSAMQGQQLMGLIALIAQFVIMLVARDRALNGTLQGSGWPGIDDWKRQGGLNGLPGALPGLTTNDAKQLAGFGSNVTTPGYQDSLNLLNQNLTNQYNSGNPYLQDLIGRITNQQQTNPGSIINPPYQGTLGPGTASSFNAHLPVKEGRLSSPFGWRSSTNSFHAGVDLSRNDQKPIFATGSGTIAQSGSAGGYGNAIYILHDDRRTETRYGHCSRLLEAKNARVWAGKQIALVGSTGHSTGPHLHFEIRQGGKAVNPLPHFPGLPQQVGQYIQ